MPSLMFGLAILSVVASSEGAAQPIRMAAIPLRTLSNPPEIATAFLDDIRLELEERGVEFVDVFALEDLLRRERIRYTDSMSRKAARTIHQETGAAFILLGTLLAYDSATPPRVALSLRVLEASSGRRIRSVVTSLHGDDFKGLLGLGEITDPEILGAELLARVVPQLDPREEISEPTRTPKARRAPSLLYLREGFDPAQLKLIAVLPMENRTHHPDAGEILAEILSHQWFELARVQVVERAELLAGLVQQKVRSMANLDLERLGHIGETLNTRYFVMGSVDQYEEAVLVGAWGVPVFETTLRILDVSSGDIVAAVTVCRRGDDTHRILGLGVTRDSVDLVMQGVLDLIATVLGA